MRKEFFVSLKYTYFTEDLRQMTKLYVFGERGCVCSDLKSHDKAVMEYKVSASFDWYFLSEQEFFELLDSWNVTKGCRDVDKFGKLPAHMTFSIAALMAFYTGTEIRDGVLIGHRNGEEYSVKDDMPVLEFFRDNCEKDTRTFVTSYLGREDFHGQDLNQVPGLTDAVTAYLDDIKTNGMRAALCRIS